MKNLPHTTDTYSQVSGESINEDVVALDVSMDDMFRM